LFTLSSDYSPAGDQPRAIDRLAELVIGGGSHSVLLGITGSGKTFTLANVISRLQRPALVISPNKTLAAQLYGEFKSFFPHSAVEYFVSYYDYYQPEAYIPQSDTYIEKDALINDEIDRMRHSTTKSLFERRDVVIVASVSAIYGLGAPVDYGATVIQLKRGGHYRRDGILRHLVDLQYQRNDAQLGRAKFRVRGDVLEVQPPHGEYVVRIDFFGDEVERIVELDPLTGEIVAEHDSIDIFPAKHFVTSRGRMDQAIASIEQELAEQVEVFKRQGKVIEAQRTTLTLAQRDAVKTAAADSPLRRLVQVKGAAVTGASVLLDEGLVWRDFRNRRQVGGILGFTPVPYQSGEQVRDQGIDRAGNSRWRALSVQLAWRWVQWQPDSALTRRYDARFGRSGPRARRIGIGALARKLLVALWRYVTTGVVPAGATLKTV